MTTMLMDALSVDAELLPALSGDATVHSVFGSVVNVVAGQRLWSLGARHVPLAPGAIRVSVDDFDGLGLAPGTLVRAGQSTIRLGEITVDLSGAARWRPEPIAGPVRADRFEAFAAELAAHGRPGGVVPGQDPFSRAVAERIADGLSAIERAVVRDDPQALGSAVARLVGLGTGLTPAGDDLLTGLAFASATLGGSLSAIPAAVARAARPDATHVVSVAAMREACSGRAVEPLSDVLATLCGRGPDGRTPEVVAALLAIGHTSGTDLAHGLAAAVRLHRTTPLTQK
ncbi:MAG: DUF2877 domain-containing protein [Tessaracoccus sp.]|uniref:oxamate carbamoyltransferase subunit AllH family protein n=1 Tax=Tessaracoccus sp. TaxID=1971211 RepID=UPI001EB21394|nr:DUF2877 domain-containing protein [Tessaracoccus sp.]MBK7821009.1 DUF2877 domain-containing protein [Tessaracoccus sp.]